MTSLRIFKSVYHRLSDSFLFISHSHTLLTHLVRNLNCFGQNKSDSGTVNNRSRKMIFWKLSFLCYDQSLKFSTVCVRSFFSSNKYKFHHQIYWRVVMTYFFWQRSRVRVSTEKKKIFLHHAVKSLNSNVLWKWIDFL